MIPGKFTHRSVTLLLAVLFYLIPWPRMGVAAEAFGVPLVLYLTIFLPGSLLARHVWPDSTDRFEKVARSGAMGLFLLCGLCFFWSLTDMRADVFRLYLPVPAVVMAIMTSPRRDDRPLPDARRDGSGIRRLSVAVLLVIVAFAAASYVTGPMIDFGKDSIDHIGYVEEIARTGEPFPTTAFYKNPGANGADLRKNLLHAAYGLYRVHLGLDSVRLFSVVGGAFAALLGFMVYASALWMFNCRTTALLSVLLFYLSYQGGLDSNFLRCTYYPNRFGVGILLMFIATAVQVMRAENVRLVAVTAALAFTAAAIHIQFAPLVLLVVATILIWRTCSPAPSGRTHWRRGLIVGIAATAGVVPVGIFRFVTAYQRNELHDQVQGAMYVAGKWFVADPVFVWHWAGPIGVASILALIPLWRFRKEVPGIGYVGAAFVTAIALQMVPFFFTPLYQAVTYLAFRVDRIAPFYMLSAYLLARPELRRATFPNVRRGSRLASAAVALAVFISLLPLVDGGMIFGPESVRASRSGSHAPWAHDLEVLSSRLDGRAVIASDPVTSYVVSGFTPHFVVCTLDQHAPPNDRLSQLRMAAARIALNPLSSDLQRARAMQSSGATHILVNEDLSGDMVLSYWAMDPQSARKTRKLLEESPELFSLVGSSGGLTLFAWNGAVPESARVPANDFVVTRVPADAGPIEKKAGVSWLAASNLTRRVHTDHEFVDVDLYWAQSGESVPANYVVSIRFDYVDLDLPLGGKPFPKITRKLKEKISGRRFRFRSDHMMSHGLFAPDVWPRGSLVHDRTAVTIPPDAAAGTYRVEVIMLPRAHVPNYRLRDFFYDDDIYTGVTIGAITIAR